MVQLAYSQGAMDPVQTVLAVAEQGNEQAMAVFLEQGKANVCDEEGFTPLMTAAASGKENTVRMLLQVRDTSPLLDTLWEMLVAIGCLSHVVTHFL